MNEAQKIPVNWCFGGNCPPTSDQEREQAIKDALTTARQRTLAKKAIKRFSEEGRCNIAELLERIGTWAENRRVSLYVFEYLVERVEEQRNRNALSPDRIEGLEKAKLLLKKLKQ